MKPQTPNLLAPALHRRVYKIARKAKAVRARKADSTTAEDRRDLKRALASEKRARTSQPLNEVMREVGLGRLCQSGRRAEAASASR